MNTSFKIGSLVVRVPVGKDNPEINVSLEEISFEVTDMSLTEYATVLKTLLTDGAQVIKEIGKEREEYEIKRFEREEKLIQLRIKEQEARNTRFQEVPSFEHAAN